MQDGMDVDGQNSQQRRNDEAETEEQIEAEAEAEMHQLRNMVNILFFNVFSLNVKVFCPYSTGTSFMLTNTL